MPQTALTPEQHLAALLATHAEPLRELLGHLWPVRPFKIEQFGPLTKYTLGQLPDGRWAMLHYVAAPDAGPPHCHPCEMESHILQGGYYERRFRLEPTGAVRPYRVTLRLAGEVYFIQAPCIHQVLELAGGPCWSLVFAGPVVREWRHYPDVLAAAVFTP